MNTTLIIVLVIFFFILLLIAVIVAVVWANNRSPGAPGIGQSCTGTCSGDLICSAIDDSSSSVGVCLIPVGGSCSISSQCTNLAMCSNGLCKYSNGAPCSTNSDCYSNICLSGICQQAESNPAPSLIHLPGYHRRRENLGGDSDITFGEDSDFNTSTPDFCGVDKTVGSDSAIDATVLGTYTLILIGSGDIIIQKNNDQRVGLTEDEGKSTKISLNIIGIKLDRIFSFRNELYGISDKKIYKLETGIKDLYRGGSWIPIVTQQEITHISCTLDGGACWIQNTTNGRLIAHPREFSLHLPPLVEQGIKILGRIPQINMVIKPDRSVQYLGRKWTNVTSAVLLHDDLPMIEHNPNLRLVVLGREVVTLE